MESSCHSCDALSRRRRKYHQCQSYERGANMDIGIELEWYRNPIKLELVRHVIPLLGFCCFLTGLIGYHLAWKVVENAILR